MAPVFYLSTVPNKHPDSDIFFIWEWPHLNFLTSVFYLSMVPTENPGPNLYMAPPGFPDPNLSEDGAAWTFWPSVASEDGPSSTP
jgi:hypothetical protein